jgi:hypothetical protein
MIALSPIFEKALSDTVTERGLVIVTASRVMFAIALATIAPSEFERDTAY